MRGLAKRDADHGNPKHQTCYKCAAGLLWVTNLGIVGDWGIEEIGEKQVTPVPSVTLQKTMQVLFDVGLSFLLVGLL